MPHSFDFTQTDPCAGTWDVAHADGSLALKLTFFRYRSLSVMHVSGAGFGESNNPAVRQDPRSVAVTAGSTRIVLRCAGDRAVMELTTGMERTQVFAAHRGLPEPLASAVPSPTASPPARMPASVPAPAAPRASIIVVDGDVVDVGTDGMGRRLTSIGGFTEPVLSPDGHTVAAIHHDEQTANDERDGNQSLWLMDTLSDTPRPILRSRASHDRKRDLVGFGHPRFSLDGGFVYVDTHPLDPAGTVHQVDVRTRGERYVVDGCLRGVIRTGPYRGYLLVQRLYRPQPPEVGLRAAVYVVRPDADELFMVPGSDRNNDNGVAAQAAWLRANGGTAS